MNDYSNLLTVLSNIPELSFPFKEGYIDEEMQRMAPMFDSTDYPGEKETDTICFIDPRLNQLGTRIICPVESLDHSEYKMAEDEEIYDVIRMSLGIAEGFNELNGQLPLNYSMHMLNGISFNKGCYLGHELTQRTFQTGVVRKVTLPFLISKNKQLIQSK